MGTRRRTPVSNPFGDSDSDEDITNPFATKRAGTNTSTSNGSNPFGSGRTPTNSAPATGTSSNPFGDDDDNEAAPLKSSNTNPFQDPRPSTAGPSNTNPFNDDSTSSTANNSNVARPPSQSQPPMPPLQRSLAVKKVVVAPPLQRSMASKNITATTSVDPFESNNKPHIEDNNAASATSSSNPFDFEPDFGGKPEPTERRVKSSFFAGRSNRNKDEDVETEPIITKMDEEDNFQKSKQSSLLATATASTNSTSLSHSRAKSELPKDTLGKPGPLNHRSKSEFTVKPLVGSSIVTNNNTNNSSSVGNSGELKLAGWLRGNKVADEETFQKNQSSSGTYGTTGTANTTPADNNEKRRGTKKNKESNKQKFSSARRVTKKKMSIQRWPYDDFHKEQEKHYQSLQEEMDMAGSNVKSTSSSASMMLSSPTRISNRAEEGEYHSGSDDDGVKGDGRGKGLNASNNGKGTKKSKFDNNDNTFMERPNELVSIKEAVQNLSLFEFENKAEERAISIVSTWLFDAGLIDELLVNGVMHHHSSSASVGDASRGGGSVKSSEGVEVGVHGFPILGHVEGGLKMDKEVEKLRAGAQRELSLINARLNDGVAASGAEVQELVNAVEATKSDLGRLRELSTYISNGYGDNDGTDDVESSMALSNGDIKDEFLLANYPRLKRCINARRNLFRCFRELEFFSQISSTCDRLREELHQGEWTADEYITIRNVCMEHVELEILLVEAEAGMKARITEDEMEEHRARKRSSGTSVSSTNSTGNYTMVDNFLSPHVKNVWELGDEIRMRILSGFVSSFDLALQNPSGMVALVEAVEVYERAAEQYKAVHNKDNASTNREDNNRLHFTDMRAAALSQLFQDFELRGLEVFRAIHMQAADTAAEDDALNSQFNAVLRAATELVTEIDVVKNQMAPCYAPHWHVEMLWSSCVAHVCSNQIIQQIGGPEGNNLPDLTVTQLLDLVAWVEFFRETIEESFPSVATMHAKKTYFDTKPDLFAGDEREVNMENATDSLAWVNNMLWEVHRLAQDEFLNRTRSQTEKWLDNVYDSELEGNVTSEGRLTTSLCEDVFSLASVQLRTIRERLTRKSEALIMAVCLIFSQLRLKQITSRDKFLKDLETCCAAANDFQRMSEKCEDVLQELLGECDFTEESINTLEASSGELLAVYSGDAVYAAQIAHLYVFKDIQENIKDFFEPEWETELTYNERAATLTQTLDDFMGDLEEFLDDFMLKKTVDALVTSSILFYIRSLLLKAENHNNNKVSFFNDNEIALQRMDGDIRVIRKYFEGLIEGMPALAKVIEKEFEVLTTVHELLRIASELSESDASDFILVLHKRIKDVGITKHFVGDLWHLVQPTQERAVWELVESLEETLIAVSPPDESAARTAHDRMNVPGLRLDEMLAKLYIESKRKRPVKPGVVEKMTLNWKMNWTTEE